MELYTLVLGLDVLGNPVNVVKGVVGGTIDLFYEPIKVWNTHSPATCICVSMDRVCCVLYSNVMVFPTLRAV